MGSYTPGNTAWPVNLVYSATRPLSVKPSTHHKGIAKNLLAIPEDGIETASVRLSTEKLDPGEWCKLVGKSGYVYGAALRSGSGNSLKPIFVSPGHKLSVDTSIKLTKLVNRKFRIPEPIRLADQLSRRRISHLSKRC